MTYNQSKKAQSLYGAVSRLIKVKAGLNIDLNAKFVSAGHNESNKTTIKGQADRQPRHAKCWGINHSQLLLTAGEEKKIYFVILGNHWK